jgi:hypothetical protein
MCRWSLKAHIHSKIFLTFQVVAPVVMKTTVFQDVMPCSLVDTYQYFGGTCYLSLQHGRAMCTGCLFISFSFFNFYLLSIYVFATHSSVVVKALCSKPEGRRFETRWGEWIFSIYLILPAALGPGVHSASLTEISTRSRKIMYLGSKAWPVRRADNLTAICGPTI